MQYKKLGSSDLMVSEICLGSMTWGTQNTPEEGHAQIDMALDYGVNIIDTAEVYPVNPMSAETQGSTERIIGQWIQKSGKRDKVMLATKVAGAGYAPVREGSPISRANIQAAMDASLRSLCTDYVDLYQLHWPNRGGYMFRRNWDYDPTAQVKTEVLDHMLEVLETLNEFVKAGKIRAIGLSNETAWGVAQWVRIADENGLPRMCAIQNEYSLLHRLFDTDLAEASHNEQVGLLAYSPLSGGLLSNKYKGGAECPAGSRMSINNDMFGRITPRLWDAIAAYKAIADKHGYDMVGMCIAWLQTRPFMGSVIPGATSVEQLRPILESTKLTLSAEAMADIAVAHKAWPMPF